MPSDFADPLHAMAEVIVRVGVNLQPGQALLITEPYELQGVHPEAGPLVAALHTAASKLAAGCPQPAIEVIPSDLARLRALVQSDDLPGYAALISAHTRRMRQHLARGGAFLFLLSSQPQLMAGLPADRLARFDAIKWRHLGPIIQRLVRGASQWTLAPAPSAAWADAAFADLPTHERLPSLWRTVYQAMRVCGSNVGGSLCPDGAESGGKLPPPLEPTGQWHAHLAGLARQRDALNAARHRRIRYLGPGTDLTLDLPRSHAWCTAQLTSRAGVPFVANLPTEEVFTAPHKNSANGMVRIARPVIHGGAVIDGIELEFSRGRVVRATATTGQDVLQHLLATDDGAGRIGEVALVSDRPRWASVSTPTPVADRDIGDHRNPRLFHHTLLDENAANHIALGDAYRFCSRAWLPVALNSSQVHLDLPLDATAELS